MSTAVASCGFFCDRTKFGRRFPDFALNRPYTIRGTVVFDVGTGGQAGRWSDVFIERIFPIRERSQSLEREVRF
jgi:hypothetical protein